MTKNIKNVIEPLRKRAIIGFYVRSVLVGFFVVSKWIISFLWSYVYNNKKKSKYDKDDNNIHDKPPTCLMDNTIGRHSYVKLKGVKIHYVEAGSKDDPLVLLLHGFPDCWLGWRHQIPELSRFFHVVALDLKGFNDSDKPMWTRDYKPKTICKEIAMFIQALGVQSATIIGHDLGGLIGWFFAHTYPDYVDRFIAVSTSHPNYYWDNISEKNIFNKNWIHFVQLPFIPEIAYTKTDSEYLEKSLEFVSKGSFNKDLVKGSLQNSSNIVEAYKFAFSRKSDWTGPLNYYRNFPFYRIKDNLMIRCPCLIITGNEDQLCRLEYVVKSTDYCENFVVKIIEGAAHWPHQQMPDDFNRTILKFLVGRRASQTQKVERSGSKGLVGRMIGAVTNSVKIGGLVLDSVQQKTNEVIQGALL